MKTSFLIVSLSLLSLGTIQVKEFEKFLVNPKLNHSLFHTSDFILNPLTIKTDSGYDGIIDSNLYEIQSTALINQDSLRTMRFAYGTFISEDSIKIEIRETSPAYHQVLTIWIVNETFSMSYAYDMSGPLIHRKIKTLNQSLVLKNGVLARYVM